MATLQTTGLVIIGSPLDPSFCGTLQEFYEAMIERMAIRSPSGIAFFSQGSVLPSSNMGLFLLNGTQLYVFNEDTGVYEPLDISASESESFFIGPDDPGTPGPDQPVFWLRTNGNRLVGVYAWTGVEWRASSNIDNSGATAQRPLNPTDLEHYFDSDINVELRFERGAWRTAGGSPGDLKYVSHPTLSEALRYNPGWLYYGENDQTLRGKTLAGASKDPGATPAASYPTDSGITPRAAGDQFGEENHVLTSPEHEPHVHSVGVPGIADAQGLRFHRPDDGDTLQIPAPVPPNYWSFSGDSRVKQAGTSGPGGAGDGLITSGQFLKSVVPSLTGDAVGHNTVQPSVFQWLLVKQ